MATQSTGNTSQVYLQATDNISQVMRGIAKSVNDLNASMNKVGSSNNNLLGGMNNSLIAQLGHLKNIDNSIAGIGGNIVGVVAKMGLWLTAILSVKQVGEALFQFFEKGIKVTMETETARNGIAGLIATLYSIKDAEGNMIKGPEAFSRAVKMADSDVKKLRLDALNTGASFKEALSGYQAGLGPGAQLGFTRNNTRELTTMMTNAAKAMGMDKGMVGQEIRALLTGKIDKNATIATNLGFGPGGAMEKAYEIALKSGKAFDFFKTELADMSRAGQLQAESLAGTFDAMSDVFDAFAMKSSEGLAKSILNIKTDLKGLFNGETGDFSTNLEPIIAMFNTIGEVIGDYVVGGIRAMIEYVLEFGQYLAENQSILNGTIEIVSLIGDVFGGIIDIVKSIFGSVLDVIQAIFGVNDETEKVNEKFDGMARAVQIVTGFVAVLNITVGLIKDTVMIVADSIRLLIGGAINFVMGMFTGFINVISGVASKLGLDKVSENLDSVTKGISDSTGKLTEKIIGEKNRLVQAYNTPIGDKSVLFQDLGKAWDKSTESVLKSQDKSNKTYQKFLDDMTKRRTKPGALEDDGYTATAKNPAKPKEPKKKKGGGKGEDTDKLAYENELKELERLAQREKDIISDKTRYLELDRSNNLISIGQYFSQKNKLEEDDYQTQLAFLNKQLEITKAQKADAKKVKDMNKLDDKENELLNKRAKLEQDYAFNSKKNFMEQTKAVRDYINELKGLDAQILEMSGGRGEARKIKLQIEMDGLKEKYKADPEALAKINNLEKLKIVQEQFNTISEDFNTILETQTIKEERINILQSNGRISELDGMTQIRDSRRQYIGLLSEQIEKLNEVYNKTKDPAVLNSIDKLKNKMLELELTVDPLKNKFDELFENSFAENFSAFVEGTKSASQAFKDFAKSIEKELFNLASKSVAKELSNTLFGAFKGKDGGDGSFGGLVSSIMGGGSSKGIGSIFSSIGSALGFPSASGGMRGGDKPYLIGESGPELFFPNGQSGYVANAPMTQSLMRGGQSSGTIIQNINISTPNYASFNNSDGQVGAQMAGMLSRARRNM